MRLHNEWLSQAIGDDIDAMKTRIEKGSVINPEVNQAVTPSLIVGRTAQNMGFRLQAQGRRSR